LKQLQLIQILCINAPSAAAVAEHDAKAAGVNRIWRASDRANAPSSRAAAGFGRPEKADLAGPALYRAVTASMGGRFIARGGAVCRALAAAFEAAAAGIETPAERRSNLRLYLSAA